MATYTITGSLITIFINNKQFNTAQSISLDIQYGSSPVYGIDSPTAQEIAPGKISVSGSISGIRLKQSGGLQGANIRPSFTDHAAAPYISIRIQDRQSKEDIFFGQQCMVSNEKHVAQAKGGYRLSFDFTCIQPLMALDRA